MLFKKQSKTLKEHQKRNTQNNQNFNKRDFILSIKESFLLQNYGLEFQQLL